MCGGEGEVLKKGGESRIGRAKLEASTVIYIGFLWYIIILMWFAWYPQIALPCFTILALVFELCWSGTHIFPMGEEHNVGFGQGPQSQ